tara:strand:+ start:6357 stop:7583 length:1227 start_codon:yes stop_codon:yes gene_type:complete
MAYYFLFPENDATLYSHPDRTNMNTGGDEILELVKERGTTDQYFYPSRIVVKFKEEEISSIIQDIIGGNSGFGTGSKANLQLTSTQAKNLTQTHILQVYAISQSWNEGTNKYFNLPSASNGVTWKFRDNSIEATAWTTSTLGGIGTSAVEEGFVIDNYETVTGTTGSIVSSSLVGGPITPGGGVWYTGSGFQASQQFLGGDDLDTNFDVTDIVTKFSQSYFNGANYPTGISNQGFLIKQIDSVESNVSTSFGELQYFSQDTHTIHPPKLTFKWDDSTHNYQSSAKLEGELNVSLYRNKKEYNQNDEALFRIHVRDKYPTRTFVTSSNYLNTGYFKETSYYSIRDAFSEEEVIPFDDNYTKLSADSEGMYFKLYMKGLQPERYYRILFKHVNNDGTTIYDDDYFFKVVR